jgi:ketosteroid isomerase-like protein
LQADAATREEILLALGEFRIAIAERRLEGALALFAPDADTVVVGSSLGEVARGPLEIREFLEQLFSQPDTITWEWDYVSVSSSGDVAWLFLEGAVILGARGARPYRISGVLERRADRWLWTLFHGSEPS